MASELEVGKITTGAGSGGNDPTLIVGGTGNAQLKVRHIDGKQSYNADMGSLYLNQYSTGDVVMCNSSNATKILGKLKLDDASVAGWIQSNGSVRVDIDNDDSSTDRAFVVSRDNGSATLFSVNELGLAEFNGGISNERGVYGGTLSVADDAVGEITPPRQATFMTLSYNATSDYPSHWGALLYMDVGLSIVSNVVAGPSSAIESVNGDVTGTTGTDTKTTVGGTLATGSGLIGKIRIENRHGTSVTYNYNFFG